MAIQHAHKKRFLIPALICFFYAFFLCRVAKGEPDADIHWQMIETRHTVVRYQSLEDLKKFDKKIKYRVGNSGLRSLFSSSGPNEPADTVTRKVDALFERAQQILDMRKRIKKVTINVYHDKKQLREAFERIYRKTCHIRAWYEYSYHTIFICIDDMHEGMLAHEMAHGIIDHYLKVRPPSATAEILARYVDSHLKRK